MRTKSKRTLQRQARKTIQKELALNCIETIKLAIENLDAVNNPETAKKNKEIALRYLNLLIKE